MKVRGAYDKPFWIYKRLNNCAARVPASYDVLVVDLEEEVFSCAGYAKEATTKTSSLAGEGAAQLFNRLYITRITTTVLANAETDNSEQGSR